MAKGIYLGVDSKARRMKKAYIGIDGKARKIKKMYLGVDGKARLCYSANNIDLAKYINPIEESCTDYASDTFNGNAVIVGGDYHSNLVRGYNASLTYQKFATNPEYTTDSAAVGTDSYFAVAGGQLHEVSTDANSKKAYAYNTSWTRTNISAILWSFSPLKFISGATPDGKGMIFAGGRSDNYHSFTYAATAATVGFTASLTNVSVKSLTKSRWGIDRISKLNGHAIFIGGWVSISDGVSAATYYTDAYDSSLTKVTIARPSFTQCYTGHCGVINSRAVCIGIKCTNDDYDNGDVIGTYLCTYDSSLTMSTVSTSMPQLETMQTFGNGKGGVLLCYTYNISTKTTTYYTKSINQSLTIEDIPTMANPKWYCNQLPVAAGNNHIVFIADSYYKKDNNSVVPKTAVYTYED